MRGRKGGKAKPLKKPKKKSKELDEDDLARIEREKKDKAKDKEMIAKILASKKK